MNAIIQLFVGDLVRVHPAAMSGSSQHYGRGELLAINGKEATILPLGGHKHTERVSLSHLKRWKAKCQVNAEIAYARN